MSLQSSFFGPVIPKKGGKEGAGNRTCLTGEIAPQWAQVLYICNVYIYVQYMWVQGGIVIYLEPIAFPQKHAAYFIRQKKVFQ